ncbi:4'-phosphopantetheinyl transferase family protein [Actinokineospora sp. UTMC 2448]|uniref:4'-phosphopantetheinyl transferase family protein n=1 Tax=Actinokineospora sp. UTMC 2448 TaxID=2268449 RepID=UPI0037C0B00A
MGVVVLIPGPRAWVAMAPVRPAARGRPDHVRAERHASRALLGVLLDAVGAGAQRLSRLDSGRPVLPDRPDLAVSLSHSGGTVAAAVARGRSIGVDVQIPLDPSPGLLARCCGTAAARRLSDAPRPVRARAFARVWSVQEACVKATGEGLAGAPWRIPVGIDECGGDWRGHRWHVIPGFTCAAAVCIGPEPG